MRRRTTNAQRPPQSALFPHEALEPVAQRLPVLDVVRLARVCRAWREQLGRTVLTEPLSIEGGGSKQRRASVVAWLGRNLQRTRDLELVRWNTPLVLKPAAADGLVSLKFDDCGATRLPSLASCTALKELEVYVCGGITELPPLDALHQLTLLVVGGCCNLERLPPLDSCRALVELRVLDNHALRSLPSLHGLAPTLKGLAFGNILAYERLVAPQSLTELTGLTRLELIGCKAKTLPSLDGFPQLKLLDISFCDVTASQLTRLTELEKLETLLTANCCRVGHDAGDGDDDDEEEEEEAEEDYIEADLNALYRGAELPPLMALPALTSLSLGGYGCAHNGENFPDLSGLTRLTELSISGCSIQSAQLAPLAGFESLVELSIYDCDSVSELPGSLAACGQLRLLRLSGFDELPPLPDLSGCKRLETLELADCRGLAEDWRPPPGGLAECVALTTVSVDCDYLPEAPEFIDFLDELRSRGVCVHMS